MPTTIPGAIKRNVYLSNTNQPEKRETQLPDVEWVNDEITAEETRATTAEATLQANITAEETRAKGYEDFLKLYIDVEKQRAETAEGLINDAAVNMFNAEEARAIAAEATKEDSANKLASTSTWAANETNFPTTAATDARIDAKAKVVWATYDVTTLAQLREWNTAGKVVLLNRQAGIYRMSFCNSSWAAFSLVTWNGLSGTTPLNIEIRQYKVDKNGWTFIPDTKLEMTQNKKSGYSTWTEWDDTSYPTCHAVDSRFEKKSNKLDSTTTWASNDDKFPTTAAADAKYEQKSNKLASTDTYASDDTHFPTTALMEAKITAMSPKSVEWATYNVTTWTQIREWHTAGKIILCQYGDDIYQMVKKANAKAVFASVCYNNLLVQNPQGIVIKELHVDASDYWMVISDTGLELTSNRVPSTSYWPQDNNHYPTTAAVDARIASMPSGDNVMWAVKDITTIDKLNEWYDAGKCVLCDVSGVIYEMDYCSSSYASLTNTTWTSRAFGNITSIKMRSYVVDSFGWESLGQNGIELTRNQITSANTWTSDNNHYATTAAIDARITAVLQSNGLISS